MQSEGATMDLLRLNPTWKEWEIVEKIGEGAHGRVYKIMRVHHGVTFYAAMKVISIPQNSSEITSIRSNRLDDVATKSYFEGVVSDFIKEIRLMVSLKGAPNIVNIEDYEVIEKSDEIGWDIYIRMELLTSLNDYIEKHHMESKDIVKLGQDICSALEFCAKKNIIHRDIKPENIFVSESGNFKIGDFGVARELEKTSSVMSTKGTYTYMAPEIVNKNLDATVSIYSGKQYDNTVDIYSLGLVLYKLLNNNRLPFLNPDAQFIKHHEISEATQRRFSGEPIPAPATTNKALVEVVLKACAFKPNQRYQSAEEMKDALEGTVQKFQPKEKNKYCINCAEPYKPEDLFCAKCGKNHKVEPDYQKGNDVDYKYKSHKAPSLQQLPRKSLLVVAVSIVAILFFVVLGYFIAYTRTSNEGDILGKEPDLMGTNEEQLDKLEEQMTDLNIELEEGDNQDREDYEEVIATEPHFFEMTAIDNIISDRTNSRNVAVAVLDLNTGEIHSTGNANNPFIASGFYAPLYVIVINSHTNLQRLADTMMSNVPNHQLANRAANDIIGEIGNFSQINNELTGLGFNQTSFSREFGDIAASERGLENYTTAREAVQIIERLYIEGRHSKMNDHIARNEMRLPRGTNAFIHSGRGIGNAYNVFAVVEAPRGNFIVAIMTGNIEGNRATSIVSEIFNNINYQMERVNE